MIIQTATLGAGILIILFTLRGALRGIADRPLILRRAHTLLATVALGLTLIAVGYVSLDNRSDDWQWKTYTVPDGEVGVVRAGWKQLGEIRPGVVEWAWAADLVNRTERHWAGDGSFWIQLQDRTGFTHASAHQPVQVDGLHPGWRVSYSGTELATTNRFQSRLYLRVSESFAIDSSPRFQLQDYLWKRRERAHADTTGIQHIDRDDLPLTRDTLQ